MKSDTCSSCVRHFLLISITHSYRLSWKTECLPPKPTLQQLGRCRVTDNDLAMSQNYILNIYIYNIYIYKAPKTHCFHQSDRSLKKSSMELQEAQFVGACLCREGRHHTPSLRLPGLLQPELAYSLLGCMGKVSRFSERKAEDGNLYFCLISSSWFHSFPDVCPSFQVLDDHSMSAADWSGVFWVVCGNSAIWSLHNWSKRVDCCYGCVWEWGIGPKIAF